MSRVGRLVTLLAVGLAFPTLAMAQTPGRGTITGTIAGQGGTPVAGARVVVVGTTIGAMTDQSGAYRIAAVPVGAQTIRAAMLGYSPQSRQVTVATGETVTANFTLQQAALQLGGVIVTATGREQSTREIGGTVGVITTADVNLAPVPNAAGLLQGKVSGVVVTQSSGTTGGGARVRIRGANSMSLSNAPLIVIDGVRVENAENEIAFGVGGQKPSRLNDIDPNDIETMEILKGPAAAALYGTAAANGVIQITTKRGSAGRTDFRVWAEQGSLDQQTSFPTNVQAVGTLVTRNAAGVVVPTAAGTGRCDIIRQAIGANPTGTQVGCTGVTNTYSFNPLEAGGSSVFQTGRRQALGLNVAGGGEQATYYLSSDWSNEHGVQPMNTQQRVRVQANTTGRFHDILTLGANVSYLDNRSELPQSDNALFGLVPMGLFGSASPANVAANQGFQSDPAFFYDWRTFQNYTRVTGSTTAEARPLSWLSFNGTAGVDRYAREDRNLVPRVSAYGPAFGDVYTNGFIQSNTYNIVDLTTNGSGTAIFNLRPDLVSTTSLGGQFIRENNHQIYAFGAGLTPGIETSLAGATSDFSAGEANLVNATVSQYAQEQLAWRDRVFLNAAVRRDKNTAFGQSLGWTTYPSFSGSWVLSDESFFPQISALSNLRLRAAYGKAGLRPGPADAIQAFASAVTSFSSQDVAAIVFNSIGNPDLQPEVTTETEFGFESQFFSNRLGLQLTHYSKHSDNALVSRPLPGSAGSATSRFENIGRVDNSGTEYEISATPLRRTNLEWNARLTGSFNHNELVSLGTNSQGQPNAPILIGSTQRHTQGYALGSYFHFPITGYADANGDGLLSPSEVTVRRDTVVYLGNPMPKREASFHTDVRLFKWASLSGLLDYKGGFQLLNQTRAWRCSTADVGNCAQLYDRATPLDQQAAIVARSNYGSYAGFIEDADFVKLREIALTLGLPQSLANRLSAKGASLTIAARNLKTWTNYTGLDPEINYAGQANFTTAEFGTVPPNRLFQLRLDANF
jgi:TonB-dependent starch-binding outer membrane protein SusC